MQSFYIGKYEVLEELGKGRFGVVYKVFDPSLDVDRALKILHPLLMMDKVFLERFKQEAKFAAKLDHPNLVPVYNLDEYEGRIFITMKYMVSGTLNDKLNKNRALPFFQVVKILEEVCSGLGFAHEHGIVHRDLKPGNILFDEHGQARISDLGLAKALNVANSDSLSSSGGLVGTPAYMAPEIWQGKEVSPATDVYSLGCILYEMLSGQILYQGEGPAELMNKHVMLAPDLPVHWSESIRCVLIRALQKEPDLRYPSADALLKDVMIMAFPSTPSNTSYDRPDDGKRKTDDRFHPTPEQNVLSRYNFLVGLGILLCILSVIGTSIFGIIFATCGWGCWGEVLIFGLIGIISGSFSVVTGVMGYIKISKLPVPKKYKAVMVIITITALISIIVSSILMIIY